MNSLLSQYHQDGFIHFKGFFCADEVEQVRKDAKQVFIKQMLHQSILSDASPEESQFEAAMTKYFRQDLPGFINCGKTCQHLISLHRMSLSEKLVQQLQALGVETPVICTRPVIYFNSRHLAQAEVYYRTPPHQDWRSMQGSLNSMVVWVPLVDVNEPLGALEIVPGSHVWGLLPSEQDEWYRKVSEGDHFNYQSVEVTAGDALFFSSFLLHRSGNNITDSIRWSCHFRYNDISEETFIARRYAHPYVYKAQQELITENFPTAEDLQRVFPARVQATAT
ncbi:MAG: phytanoyl-CoA dioxygenase family protein [Acidobacteria bacterium]|nr:phytanoyl-CoA dioxygenase family protein [Acidobacteriota bacterium]